MSRVLCVLLVSVGACGGSDEYECHAPDHTTFMCEPLPSGSDGCMGGPRWTAAGPASSVDAAVHQEAPDSIFPAGCYAKIPDCGTFQSGRLFQCSMVSGWVWVELL